MTEARQSQAWDHTAALLAAIHNMMSQKPKKVETFHPYHAPPPEPPKRVGSLKCLFSS